MKETRTRKVRWGRNVDSGPVGKRVSRLALKSALIAGLAIWPMALGESAGGQGLPSKVGMIYPGERVSGLWQDLRQAGFPTPAAVAAVAMLLLPFALSTLRLRRKGGPN